MTLPVLNKDVFLKKNVIVNKDGSLYGNYTGDPIYGVSNPYVKIDNVLPSEDYPKPKSPILPSKLATLPKPKPAEPDFYNQIEQIRKQTEDALRVKHKGKKVEVIVSQKGRDYDEQQKVLKSGASKTGISLHNFNAAADFVIKIDGKINDGKSSGIDDYRVLGGFAKKAGLFWGWGDDGGHVGETEYVHEYLKKHPEAVSNKSLNEFMGKLNNTDINIKYKNLVSTVDSLTNNKTERTYVGQPLKKGNRLTPIYAFGGDVPIQAEVGEQIQSPDGYIYPSNAETTHDNMLPNEITDILQSGSFVFSNKKLHKSVWEKYGLKAPHTKTSPAEMIKYINKRNKPNDKVDDITTRNGNKLKEQNVAIMAELVKTVNRNELLGKGKTPFKAKYGFDGNPNKYLNGILPSPMLPEEFLESDDKALEPKELIPSTKTKNYDKELIKQNIYDEGLLKKNNSPLNIAEDTLTSVLPFPYNILPAAAGFILDAVNKPTGAEIQRRNIKNDMAQSSTGYNGTPYFEDGGYLFAFNELSNLISSISNYGQKMYPMTQFNFEPTNSIETTIPVGNYMNSILAAQKPALDATKSVAQKSNIAANTQNAINNFYSNKLQQEVQLRQAKRAAQQQNEMLLSEARSRWNLDKTTLDNAKKGILPSALQSTYNNLSDYYKNKYDIGKQAAMNEKMFETLSYIFSSPGAKKIFDLWK